MRRIILHTAWIMAAVLFLAGCTSVSQTGGGADPAAESKEAAEEVQGEAKETDTEQEVLEKSAEEEREMPYSFPIVREDNFTLELLAVRDAEKGERKYYLQCENLTGAELSVTLSGIKINDSILTGTDMSLYISDQEVKISDYIELRDKIAAAERDGVNARKISGSVTVRSWSNDENGKPVFSYEGPVEILFPEGFSPRVVCVPTLSMRAHEQILKDDGNVRITLMDMGKYISSSDFRILQGTLRIENLSDREIPILISGIRVNGYYLELYGTRRGSLPAGNVLYSGFYCSSTDIENAGIEEIESVELQILTSNEENVGTIYGAAGGSWYPIELSERGSAGESAGTRIQIYEDEYIVVELTGAETVWNEYSDGKGYGHYSWEFSFTNKTDKEMRITFEDFVIDGEPDTGDFGDRYLMLCDLGANSRTNEDIWKSIDGPSPLPEISFRVQIKSAGGGSLYNYPEEYVTVTREMAEQVSAAEEEK